MAINFIDTFDAYSSLEEIRLFWVIDTNFWSLGGAGTGRWGSGRSLSNSVNANNGNTSSLTRSIANGPVADVPSNKVIASAAFFIGGTTFTGGANGIIGFFDPNGLRHFDVAITIDRRVQVLRAGSTMIAQSATDVLRIREWHRVEAEAYIDDIAGTARVWVDGQLVIDFTGDTRNAGVKGVGIIGFGVPAGGGSLGEDVLCYTTSGDAPNVAPLSDFQIAELLPTANGSVVQSVPRTGPVWQEVDDPNWLDLRNTLTTLNLVGDTDLFPFSAFSTTDTNVAFVVVATQVQADGDVQRGLKGVAKLGGVTVLSGETLCPSPIQGRFWPARFTAFALDPNGSAWTVANINAAEFGYQLSS